MLLRWAVLDPFRGLTTRAPRRSVPLASGGESPIQCKAPPMYANFALLLKFCSLKGEDSRLLIGPRGQVNTYPQVGRSRADSSLLFESNLSDTKDLRLVDEAQRGGQLVSDTQPACCCSPIGRGSRGAATCKEVIRHGLSVWLLQKGSRICISMSCNH